MTPRAARVLPVSVACLVVLYAVFYPRTFAIVDESTYLSTAYAYRAGTIFHDVAGLSSLASEGVHGHRVSKFGPLVPALFAPFTWLSWRAAFVANFGLHLLGFALFLGIVRRARLPDWTALLYLFHPTLLFYARTLMSDVAAGVFFLAAVGALWNRGRSGAFLAGLMAGISCWARETNAVLVALLLVAVAIEDVRNRGPERPRRVAAMLGGLVAPAALLIAYHQAAFGVWWRGTTGYHGTLGIGATFSPRLVPDGLLHYGIALLVLYPGMLLAFVLDRRQPLTSILPALGFTLFFCFYYYRESGAHFAETTITSLRFLIPVLPLFLLSYARVLVWLLDRARVAPPAVAITVAALGIVGAAGLQLRHDQHLRAQAARRDALYEATSRRATVLCDARARELVHHVWGDRRLESIERQGRWVFPAVPPGDVYVALVGGDRAGNPEGVPAPLGELLAACGAEPATRLDEQPRLRVWRLDAARYRARETTP